MPDDGSEPPSRCVLGGLAELLDVSCEVAIVVANIIGFGLLGAVLIVSFIIIKRKYVVISLFYIYYIIMNVIFIISEVNFFKYYLNKCYSIIIKNFQL